MALPSILRKRLRLEWPVGNTTTVEEEVKRLEELGYRVTGREGDVVSLAKRRAPPLTFLLYLLDPILVPAMIINWVLGYRFTARVYERDGRIVTE